MFKHWPHRQYEEAMMSCFCQEWTWAFLENSGKNEDINQKRGGGVTKINYMKKYV